MDAAFSRDVQEALAEGGDAAAAPAEQPLRVTARAFRRVESLLQREGLPGGALRVGLRGGGCAGFEYALKLDAGDPGPDDLVLASGAARVFVDPKSLRLLRGSVLDFTEGLNGRGFVFENPNATRTCGCGTSFST